MDKKELTRECIRIENQILKIDSNEPDVKPIIDGIINIDEFLSSKFKIMWILKEPNGLQDNKGGGWSS
ncbi:MAG: hypothetical protein LKI59_05600 [Bacteroidales bacterium]|jgi:hypothetical protein|nr:hypothetical protein [Bacteroidales bacterium]